MESTFRLKLAMEMLWWLATGVLVFMVLWPLYGVFTWSQFIESNIMFIIVSVTATRYAFLWRHTFLSRIQPLKIFVTIAFIPVIFYLVDRLQNFQEFVDNEGTMGFSKYFNPAVSFQRQQDVLGYFDREFKFFAVASILAALVLTGRMVISLWRTHNTKDEV